MSEPAIITICACLLIIFAVAMGFVMSRHGRGLLSRSINTNSYPRFRKV